MLVAPPAGDAYNLVVDMGSYSNYVFDVVLAIGLFKLRRHRKKLGLGYLEFHCPTPLLVLVVLFSLFVIVMAFVPPKGTLKGSDVSFFYATYPIATIGLFGLCIAYYILWQFVFPRFGHYKHRMESFTLKNGEQGHRVIKVPESKLAEWDATHENHNTLTEKDDGVEVLTHVTNDSDK